MLLLTKLLPLSCVLLACCVPALAAPVPPVDLLPLKKALTLLDSAGPLQSRSSISMSGAKPGVTVTFREDLQITARRPGRFRAALTQYDAAGGAPKKLLVVSNGAMVWTYQPGSNRYSVTTLAAFEKSDSNVPALGLVIGGFYLGEGRSLVQGMHSITPTNSAEVIAALKDMDVTITRQTKSVGGSDDYVYSLTLTKLAQAYKFYVNTQTSALTRLELTGRQGGIEFSYRENIAQIKPSSPQPPAAFAFAPPPGVVKAATVPITPF